MFKTLKYQALTICWAMGILVLCSLPNKSFNNTSVFLFEGFDKIVHLGLFFVLTVFMFNGFIKQKKYTPIKTINCVLIGLIAFAFGGFIELLQWQFFTSRSGDWWDLFADTIGLNMAIFSFLIFKQNLHQFNLKS